MSNSIKKDTIQVLNFYLNIFTFLVTNQPEIPRLINSKVNVENINNF